MSWFINVSNRNCPYSSAILSSSPCQWVNEPIISRTIDTLSVYISPPSCRPHPAFEETKRLAHARLMASSVHVSPLAFRPHPFNQWDTRSFCACDTQMLRLSACILLSTPFRQVTSILMPERLNFIGGCHHPQWRCLVSDQIRLINTQLAKTSFLGCKVHRILIHT